LSLKKSSWAIDVIFTGLDEVDSDLADDIADGMKVRCTVSGIGISTYDAAMPRDVSPLIKQIM